MEIPIMENMEKEELKRMKKQWITPEIETLPVAETAQDNGNPLDPPEFPELS
jgi:hypothetical protein